MKSEITRAIPQWDDELQRPTREWLKMTWLSTTFLNGMLGIVAAISIFLVAGMILLVYKDENEFDFKSDRDTTTYVIQEELWN